MSDERWMTLALKRAEEAAAKGEVPVGAVLVDENGKLLASSGNQREVACDPCAHAEILVLRRAGKKKKSWHLDGCTLYATLEPCPMCMGAALLARVGVVVFACRDPRMGAAGSLYALHRDRRMNHRIVTREGVMAEESVALLKKFFKSRRKKK